MSDRDETRPITCAKCGRDFVSPRWFGALGPLCPTCFDRLEREERVRGHHIEASGEGLVARIRRLFGR